MTGTTGPASTGRTRSGYTVSRILDAPRELVFAAWTVPERLTHWWGPAGCTAPLSGIALDVRPGGRWRATIVDAEGAEFPFHGVYHEVAAPERLSYTLLDPNDPDFQERSDQGEPEELATVTLTDLGGRTELVFHQSSYLPEETLERARNGMASFFDCLADYLATAA